MLSALLMIAIAFLKIRLLMHLFDGKRSELRKSQRRKPKRTPKTP